MSSVSAAPWRSCFERFVNGCVHLHVAVAVKVHDHDHDHDYDYDYGETSHRHMNAAWSSARKLVLVLS